MEYICGNKCIVKNTNILQNVLNYFFIFMKVEDISNHVITHSLNHVRIPCDQLKKFILKNEFFNKDVINVW